MQVPAQDAHFVKASNQWKEWNLWIYMDILYIIHNMLYIYTYVYVFKISRRFASAVVHCSVVTMPIFASK